MMRVRQRRVRGFGLLEAIVALALLAGGGMALFAWINTNIAHAARLQQRQWLINATWLANEWVQTINPATQESGKLALAEGWNLTWRGRPVSPKTSGAPFPGGLGTPFRLALYEIAVTLSHPQLGKEQQFIFTRVATWRDPVQTPMQ